MSRKTSALTRAQLLRKRDLFQQAAGPDASEVVHRFPDGWSINRLPHPHAECYEGELMGNCVGSAKSLIDHIPQDRWYEDSNIGKPGDNYHYYSVRDPDNIPHATFTHSRDPTIHNTFGDLDLEGRSGSNASRYAPYVHDWWVRQGGKPVSPTYWESAYGEPMAEVGSPEHAAVQSDTEQYKSRGWWRQPQLPEYMPEQYKRAVRPMRKADDMHENGQKDEAAPWLESRLNKNFTREDVEMMMQHWNEERARYERMQPEAVKPHSRQELPEFYWMHGSYGPQVYGAIKRAQEAYRSVSWNHPAVMRSHLVNDLMEQDIDRHQAEHIANQWVAAHEQARWGGANHPKVQRTDEDKLNHFMDILPPGDIIDRQKMEDTMRPHFTDYMPDPDFDPAKQWKQPPPPRRSSLPSVEHAPVDELRDWLNSFHTPTVQPSVHHPVEAPPEGAEGTETPQMGNPPGETPEQLRTAGMTRTKRLELARALDDEIGGDFSSVVHQFPDGWTIRNLNSYGDWHREGTLMGNCLSRNGDQNGYTKDEWDRFDPDDHSQGFPYRAQHGNYDFFSLRDPHNLPHVTFEYPEALPDLPRFHNIYGQHNSDPRAEHLARIFEYGNTESGGQGLRIDDNTYDGPGIQRYIESLGGQRTGMAADPVFWHQHTRGRPLYHGTYEDALPSIMQTGILPWDHPENPAGTIYADRPDLTPRPGHVYMTFDPEIAHAQANLDPSRKPAVLKVDPAFVNPDHVSPDEDWWLEGMHGNPNWSRDWDELVRKVDPDWKDGKGFQNIPEFKSWGDTAERAGLGDNPEHIEHAMKGVSDEGFSNGGSRNIAYRGVVSPYAITPLVWDPEAQDWFDPPQQKTAKPVDENYWDEETSPEWAGFRDGEPGKWESLYHGTREDALHDILREGLKPWDERGGRHNWGDGGSDEWLTPRPGHTYLTRDKDFAWRIAPESTHGHKSVIEIDPAHLDPANINPDEDDQYPSGLLDNEGEPISSGDYPSRGALAEATGWGNDPDETLVNLKADSVHSIAHRGAIPPQAIKATHVFTGLSSDGPGGWKSEPNPGYRPFQRTARPADPDWWQERTEQYPYLYHATEMERLPSILQHGLVPWDHKPNSGSQYGNEFEWDPEQEWQLPRPGHVYLTNDINMATQYGDERGQNPVLLRVDPRHLDPAHINPDEDASPQGGLAGFHQTYPNYAEGEGDLSPHDFRSLGEIADSDGWGSNPDDTTRGIERTKTLAYRGIIPPEAFTPLVQDKQTRRWVPHRQQKTAAITHQPGQWARGLVTPTGEVHTWPESDGTHNAYIFNVLGDLSDQRYDKFVISPEGEPQEVSDPQHHEIVRQALERHVPHYASHGFTPCPDCGGDIKITRKWDGSEAIRCDGCRREWPDTDRALKEIMPKGIDCPKCGSQMYWRDSLGGMWPEGAWECENQRCWHMMAPGQVAPDTFVDPDQSQSDLKLPPDWTASLRRQAMAERSGFPDLDAAIEEFMRTHDVEHYRDPRNAWGQCEESARELAAFLNQRGFKAYAPADELGAFPGYEKAQDSAAIGAGDFSYPEHAMVEVYGLYGPNNVNTVTIDFTASQYGFTEFPKVHPGPTTASGPQDAQVHYHVAPASVRDSIAAHGIDYTRGPSGTDYDKVGTTPGNYLWAEEQHGIEDRDSTEEGSGQPFDIWRVNSSGLGLSPDTEWEGGHYTTEPIGPDRVTLHSPAQPHTAAMDDSGAHYHVAPASARDSISTHGLDASLGQRQWTFSDHESGIYLWDNLNDAHRYREGLRDAWGPDRGPQDIWAVHGVPAHADPYPVRSLGYSGNAYRAHPTRIPPEFVSLHTPADTAEDARRHAAQDSLWWKPGVAGRGMVMNDGTVRTWPEVEGTHDQVAMGLDQDYVHSFMIRPTGEYYTHDVRYQGTPETHAAIQGADPRLSPINTPDHIQQWWGRPLSSRVSGMTIPQYKRQMAELEAKLGPSQMAVHHQWDDGWTVRHPKGSERQQRKDIERVGALMGNCWQSGGTSGGDPYVLHDPHGIPRVAWNLSPAHSANPGRVTSPNIDVYQPVFRTDLHRPLGHNNSEPSPKYWERLKQWAALGANDILGQRKPVLQWHPGGEENGGYHLAEPVAL